MPIQIDCAARLKVVARNVAPCGRDTLLIDLEAVNGELLPDYEPGSHIDLYLPDGQARQYSICEWVPKPKRYRIAVKRESNGRGGSKRIHDLARAGWELQISAPKNAFRIDKAASRHLFIAGGIGITPILSMIDWCEQNKSRWSLIFRCASKAGAPLIDRLGTYQAECVRLSFSDRESRTAAGIGRAISEVAAGERAYCCGPQSLINEVIDCAAVLPPDTLRIERFAPSEGMTKTCATPFVVRLRKSGIKLSVPAGMSLLSVLENAGIAITSSCRLGLCGACVVDVVAGIPDHQDSFMGDAERRAGKTMLACVSRAMSSDIELDL